MPIGYDKATVMPRTIRRRSSVLAFLEWLRQRYAAGEVGAMLAGLVAWRAEPVDLAQHDSGRTALLTERNAAWIPRLEVTLGKPGVAFVAFGAAHLIGVDGVVSLLRERGWDVSGRFGDRCLG